MQKIIRDGRRWCVDTDLSKFFGRVQHDVLTARVSRKVRDRRLLKLFLQRAREKHPDEKPRVITDNGPQFIRKAFKSFVRISGMTHIRTSPYYPLTGVKNGCFAFYSSNQPLR